MASRQEAPETAGVYIFILLSFGAIGTLIGGHASDKYGRKFVIIFSLILSGPLLLIALMTDGIISYVIMAAAGTTLLAFFSPAILIAQDLIPKNRGVASSIILGLAFGIGGLGVSITGVISDAFGVWGGILSLVVLPIIGSIIALKLSGNVFTKNREVKYKGGS